MNLLDKARVVKDLATSLLTALTVLGVVVLNDAGQQAVLGVIGAVVTLAVTFLGGGNKQSDPPSVR